MSYLTRRALRRTNRKNRVTIVVGLIGKQADPETNGIVLASDSQTTWGTLQRSDTEKMSAITFADGKKVLIAQSGDSTFGSRTLEAIQLEASRTRCDDYRKPAEAVEAAIRFVKAEAIRLNNFENSPDVALEFLNEHSFSMMIAYYFADQPQLYVIDSNIGFATKQKDYAAIGCGGTVAELILSRSEVGSLLSHEAAITAVYTVEEVKRVDAFCGGPTKLAVIFQNGDVAYEAGGKWAEYVKLTVETMAKHDQELKQTWRKMLTQIVAEVLEKRK